MIFDTMNIILFIGIIISVFFVNQSAVYFLVSKLGGKVVNRKVVLKDGRKLHFLKRVILYFTGTAANLLTCILSYFLVVILKGFDNTIVQNLYSTVLENFNTLLFSFNFSPNFLLDTMSSLVANSGIILTFSAANLICFIVFFFVSFYYLIDDIVQSLFYKYDL